ncbi:ornithine cyclodeaminase [Glutamicibacter halophytocola]|uniref:ornithine cyclodeaminase n=1 Tax=Glutamicibacter halophytocola TaxID=1933880 RepID=UPI00321A7B99
MKHLAKQDAKVAAVVGPGVIAKSVIDATLSLRPSIDTVTVKGRSAAGVETFAQYIRDNFPQVKSIVAADTVEEAIKDADVIMATTSTDIKGSEAFPYFPTAAIKPGALLLLPAAARFDDDFVINDARLILDARGLYDAWAEEYGTQAYQPLGIPGTHFHDLMREGKLPESKLEEIADVATGKIPARRNDEEIILYSVGGMPIEDVAWATDLYQSAEEKNIGQVLNLWDAPVLA